MSKLFFAESKLAFKVQKSPEQSEDADVAAEGLKNETYRDTREAQKVMLEQSKLRSRLDTSDVLTDADKAMWTKKLEEAKTKAISAEEMQEMAKEFEKQQTEIKRMVDTHTQKIMDNEEAAFTTKSAKNKVESFNKQMSYEEKMKALGEIDTEIDELLDMRRQLLTRFKKKEVYKMEKDEMKDKVKQLDKIEENIRTYKGLIENDKKLFHDPDQYIAEFEDLTLQEQADWIKRYKDEVVAPRKTLVDLYEKIPAKHQNDAKFFKVGLKGKQEFLDKLDVKIEQEYLKKINSTPVDVMSQNSRKFAIVDFLRLKDVSEKAMWLEQLPKSIKVEQKLTKDYKDPKFKEIRKFDTYTEKQWEKQRFEEKEALLKNMTVELKLLETFNRVLDEGEKDKAINEKTKGRYEKIYTETNLNGRNQLCRNILYAMKVRRDLVEDFEKLDDETKKKFASFYKRGHKARLQILKEAELFDTKLKAKEEKETEEEQEKAEKEKKAPKSLESSDIEEIVSELHKEADEFEARAEFERALDKHKSVLKLHPENAYSLKKLKELKEEVDTLDTLMDTEIQDAVLREINMSSVQEEIDQIKLSQMILEDQDELIRRNRGVEDTGRQTKHLRDSSLDREVQRKLYEESGGKQMLDKEGRVTDVEQVDLGKLGKREKADIRTYKEKMRNLKRDENLSNIKLVDEDTGRELRIDEAKKSLDKRKMSAAQDIAKRVKGMKKEDAEAVITAASDLIDSELEQQAQAG
ncbi:hypothetical protein ACFLZH_02365 [Patescibacteria group bacterium]